MIAKSQLSARKRRCALADSHIRGGWTAGAGFEYAVDKNWSAKLEYLHVGLNDTLYLAPPGPNGVNRGGGVPLGNEMVRAGINYNSTGKEGEHETAVSSPAKPDFFGRAHLQEPKQPQARCGDWFPRSCFSYPVRAAGTAASA